jgi:hypothetical protein
MNKSTVIIITLLWVLCFMWIALAKSNELPYVQAAVAGCWITSALLLACVIMFIRRNK